MNPFKRIRAREVGEPSGPQARTARADELVRGERTSAIVQATRSAQSRLSSVLAAGLMLTLGLSALGWYYANALTRGARARQAAQSTATSRAQGEMPLPDLGRIAAPLPPPAEPAHGGDTAALASPGHAPELPPVETPASPTPL
ncbi:MAG: hypothetical protein ACRETP_02435, partial [Steroidobacteraceae bacterium]